MELTKNFGGSTQKKMFWGKNAMRKGKRFRLVAGKEEILNLLRKAIYMMVAVVAIIFLFFPHKGTEKSLEGKKMEVIDSPNARFPYEVGDRVVLTGNYQYIIMSDSLVAYETTDGVLVDEIFLEGL